MTRYLRKILCSAMLIVILLSSIIPANAGGVGVTVFSSSARVYSKASTSAASIRLPRGLGMTMTGASHGWARVSYKGRTGYVPLKDLNTRKRYTAYVNKNTYIYKGASSSSSKAGVYANTKVYVVGLSGDFFRIQNSRGATAYIKKSCLSTKPVKAARSAVNWKSRVVKLNWFGSGKNVLKRGSYGYLYDIKTGISLRIKRMGGSNHADVEPATKADTLKLWKMGGGKFSWDSRACILYSGGQFVAVAVNTMPHGSQTIKNNGYNGQFCLHMLGSLTHGTTTVNNEHQNAIKKAYNWAH